MGSRTSRTGQSVSAEGPVRSRSGPFVRLREGLQRSRRSITFLFAALLALPLPVPAQREPDGFHRLPELRRLGRSFGALQIERSIRLDEVNPAELLFATGDRAIAMGSWSPNRLRDWRIGDLGVVRHVPYVWRMRLPDEEQASAISVRYDITSPDGRANTLAAVDRSDSKIRMVLRSLPPVLVTRDADGVLVEGGLTLLLDLENVRSAGTYSGTLTVTIDQF